MVICRSASTLRLAGLTIGLGLASIANVPAADTGNPVILNVPAGAGLPGEGVETPYLHGMPQDGQTHTRPEDIRPPAPFGTHPDGFDVNARPSGAPSQSYEPPPTESSERSTPMPNGAPRSAR
jgi:hypothetical protein